jgi:hypothetical protein
MARLRFIDIARRRNRHDQSRVGRILYTDADF